MAVSFGKAITSAAATAWSTLTGKPTTLSGYGITNGASPTAAQTWTQTQTFSKPIRLTPPTVASLPSAATEGNGARAHVSDALAPTFGAAVVGGGAVSCPVYSDGSAWKVG